MGSPISTTSAITNKGKIRSQNFQHGVKTHFQEKRADTFHPSIMGPVAYQKIKQNCFQITGNDLIMIEKALQLHHLLYKLDKNQRRQLINYMKGYTVQANHFFIKQGDPGQILLIIKEGKVQIFLKGQKLKQVGQSFVIQDRSLVSNTPRSASYFSKTQCKLWGVTKSIYQKVLKQLSKKSYKKIKSFIKTVPLFQPLKSKEKQMLAMRTFLLKYQNGDYIFNKNQQADEFYIIVKGQIGLRIPNKKQIILRSGDSFGQNALHLRQKRSGDAICLQNSIVLSVSRYAVEQCFQGNYDFIIYNSIIKWSLRRHYPFSQMVCSIIDKIVSQGQIVLYQDQQVICSKGTKYPNLYVCLEGKINDAGIGAVFNYDFKKSEKGVDFSLIKKFRGTVFQIKFHRLNYILGNNLSSDIFLRDQKWIVPGIYEKEDNQLSMESLFFIKLFKEDEYQHTYLVHNYSELFNLRMVNKNMIVKYDHQKFVLEQKRVWKKLQNNFINRLRRTFVDKNFIYFLYDHEEYGNFRNLMNQVKTFSSEYTRFYVGCLISAVESLQKFAIVHRDIRPQNIFIDRNGYAVLGNFNYAKQLKSQKDRTITMIGTPEYSAPQVRLLFGYGLNADLWSIGVIMYQMVTGFLPNRNIYGKVFEFSKRKNQCGLDFCDYKNEAGRQLISKLLDIDPDKRMVDSIEQIKNCQFFVGFNWDSLAKKLNRAPRFPKVDSYRQMKKFKLTPVLDQIQKTRVRIGETIKSERFPNWDQDFSK